MHGFLWQNGFMTDLNALLPPGSSLTPWGDGAFINDRGEIAEMGVLPDGDVHAFLLIPCDENHPGVEGCDYSMVEVSAAVTQTSPAVRNASSGTLPQSRMRLMNGYRFPGRAFGPRN